MSAVRGGLCKAVNFGDFPNELGTVSVAVHLVVRPLMHLLLLFSLTVYIMGITAISTIFRLRLSWEGEWDVLA